MSTEISESDFLKAFAEGDIAAALLYLNQERRKAFKAGQQIADPDPFISPSGVRYQIWAHEYITFEEWDARRKGESPPELVPYKK